VNLKDGLGGIQANHGNAHRGWLPSAGSHDPHYGITDAAGAVHPIWFGDEARVGQKTKITRRWARRGSRPSAPIDQRTASTYIFGAIYPKEGKAVGLILPWCNTAGMNLHLAAISADVAPGRHAALLLDQAGWHLSKLLAVPDNLILVPLPAKCPELNPQENIWQFMRDN
jgi:hypothetical protein